MTVSTKCDANVRFSARARWISASSTSRATSRPRTHRTSIGCSSTARDSPTRTDSQPSGRQNVIFTPSAVCAESRRHERGDRHHNQRVQLRAGSCVLPLHHPLRVAEEWSVVDNLSGGRAAISFASGWQPNDFVLRPENYENAKQIILRDIETVRELWRGRKIAFPNSKGEMVEIGIVPGPFRKSYRSG